MHRFFVPPQWIQGERVRLEGDVVHQITRVLRMSTGEVVALLDNSGKEYVARLTSVARDAVEASILSVDEEPEESPVSITLYQGILKGEKFEWVLQKGTELGVTAFVPLVCQRSVPQVGDGRATSRYPRWQRIVTEAAEQSGRRLLPQVGQPVSFEDACAGVEGSPGTSIIPWEGEQSAGLRSALRGMTCPHANVFIGPEGGFEDWEVAGARSCGVAPVSLGRRILRSETAAIAAVAAVMYQAGELGG